VILAAEGLVFAYAPGLPPAVDGADIRAAAGEVIALAGPNGAGKSTLLALLAGWLPPQAGRVTLDGEPLRGLSARRRARRLAYLPQQVAPLYDPLVEDVVSAGRFPHRAAWAALGPDDRRAIDAALAATGTTDIRHRRLSTVSGGERQRVLVASALAQDPAVLLLDEPTASLDLHRQVEVFRLLRRVARSGRAVVVVTHDLNLASLYADRILLMVGGHIVRRGAPAEVLTAEALRRAYGPDLVVVSHPEGGRPAVLPDGAEGP